MTRVATSWLAALGALVAAIVPFAFGLVRAVTTRSDFRYLWMAVAAAVGAAVVVRLATDRSQTRTTILRRAGMVLGLSTCLAAAVGYVLGARAASGIGIVSVAFGLCDAASVVLAGGARRRAR